VIPDTRHHHSNWFFAWLFSAAFCLFGSATAIAQVATAAQVEQIKRLPSAPRTAALRWEIAHSHVAPTEAEIVSGLRQDYPTLGQSAILFKILNKRTQQIDTVLIDQNGRELNEEQMELQERSAYFSRYGRMEKQLAGRVAVARGNELIDVVIWLKASGYVQPDPVAPELARDPRIVELLHDQAAQQRARFIRIVAGPIQLRLHTQGYQSVADPLAPIVHTRIPARSIGNISRDLENWPEIDRIYMSVKPQPQLASTRLTLHADVVEQRKQNGVAITGSGVKIGMLEVGSNTRFADGTVVKTARVAAGFAGSARNNPYISKTVVPDDPILHRNAPSDHATAVAGIIIANQSAVRGTRMGIASGASLWAGGADNASLEGMKSMTAKALDAKSNVLNLSFGGDNMLQSNAWDRYYDEVVYSGAGSPSVVVAAGNNGGAFGTTTGNINYPALAYNVICVGAYDDGHMPGVLKWNDSRMAAFSSYVAPANRQIPEIAAPGVMIRTALNTGPVWFGNAGSGTSYAAPHVTGLVGLMMQRNPDLKSRPAEVKAILIASAAHRARPPAAGPAPNGVDGVVADYADDVARGQNGGSGTVDIKLDMPSTLTVGGMSLRKGKLTRVAIAWLNDPDSTSVTYGRETVDKFDLEILDPMGNIALVAPTTADSYRSIGYFENFRPPMDGNYIIQVRRATLRAKTTLGFAWWQRPSPVLEVQSADGSPEQAIQGGLNASLWFTTDHMPLANRPLTFHIEGDPVAHSVRTDAQGNANLPYTVPLTVVGAAKKITVDFAGDADFDEVNGKLIGPASGTAMLDSRFDTVVGGDPTIFPLHYGVHITFAGTLLVRHPDGQFTTVSGKELNFYLNGKLSFSGITDPVILWNYTVPHDPDLLGLNGVNVRFDGDGEYRAADGWYHFTVDP